LSELLFRLGKLFLEEFGTCMTEIVRISEYFILESVFSGVRVTRSLVFCVVFCRSLFVFSEVRVTQSLVLCVMFCISLFVLCTFSFGHCVVCSFSIYRL